jgi:hypothetical protein
MVTVFSSKLSTGILRIIPEIRCLELRLFGDLDGTMSMPKSMMPSVMYILYGKDIGSLSIKAEIPRPWEFTARGRQIPG